MVIVFNIISTIVKADENSTLTPSLYADVLRTLSIIRGGEHTLCALSSENENSLVTALVDRFFDYSVSDKDDNALEKLAEMSKNNISSLVCIGGCEEDICAAKKAGCISVLLDRGRSLSSFGQDYTISELSELIKTVMPQIQWKQ